MEVTDENLATLANYLQQTLNPDPNVRRPAEKFLESVEINQNYAILLLHLIDKDTVDMTIRVAAAIAFKNYIKRNWPVEEDGQDRIHASDRATIKTLIVNLMLKSPEAIQRQFSDAVSIIGKSDFPEKWPSLIPEMVEKFATGDFHVINGVLRTAHSLFKRYRYEFKSQRLWEEIKHVLDNFAKPLTDLFMATLELRNTHANNPAALKVIYGSLVLICKVFYSLNCQDLPEYFEDNMAVWMPNLLNLLQAKVPCLETDDDSDAPGVMEQLRTEVCECASLYALKYEEEFAPHAPAFVTSVWTVLLSTGAQTKYDASVTILLKYEEEFAPHAPAFVTSVWTVLLSTGAQTKYDASVTILLKYEEEFAPHAPAFVTSVWTVLLSTGAQTKYDASVTILLKYEEEFAPHAPAFVTSVWTVLLSTGAQTKYDASVTILLKYEEEFAPHAPAFVTSVWTVLLSTGAQTKYDASVTILLKYEEEFAPHAPAFVTSVWTVLLSTGAQTKYDASVTILLKYEEEFAPHAPSFVTSVWTVLLSTGAQTKYDASVTILLKYEEEFAPHAPAFVTSVWTVLLSTGAQTKYDALVANALTFLAKVAEKTSYKSLFEDPNTLSSICEKVVIPNMEFRESDMELFEDNPEEYVRRDIEGSDVDTRRRAACDLVKTLAQHYEDKMMTIFGQYVQLMLAKYGEAGAAAWRGKDAAMYLVTSLATRGSTAAAGVTRASPLVDLAQFAANHVVPELQRPGVTELPVLKADAIKYLMTFRSLLPKELLVNSIPLVIQHIQGRGVVCTYAACCVEKLVAGGMVTRQALLPHAATALQALFAVIEDHNEYVMKAILRVLACLQEDGLSYLGEALPKLALMLSQVAKNPCKPHFNHYLFETLSLAVSLVTKSNPNAIAAFEDALFPIFQEILQNDIQEFMPYVFQMLSLLLELRGGMPAGAAGGDNDAYGALLPCLVAPPLWERPANVRPLVRLLCAFVACRSQLILNTNKLNAMLGVFQKLIASKTNDHEGFYLIQTMLYKFGESVMQPYTKQIVTLLFQRLSSSKTTKYVRGLIAFLGFYAAHFGADNLVDLVDSVQTNMFAMYTERVLITDLQKVSGVLERKAAAVGCVKLLCESGHFRQGALAPLWPKLAEALIALFELPTDESTLPDDHFIEVDDTPGYQAAYSHLTCAKGASNDPLASITDPKRYFAESLGQLARASPGLLPPRLQALSEHHRNALTHYLQTYGVQIC
ncbi:cse1 domain-containing protein [Phthorimaea operculella]|nr:cse1 domain-containing protein [Phthorimaea operculella]